MNDFFERAFIDNGAVSWPGDIDLAPDAMHADVAGRHKETELSSQAR